MTDEEIKALSPEALLDRFMSSMQRISLHLHEVKMQLRTKPLVGGRFGHGGFVLVSHWTIDKGLDEVTYYVADADSLFMFSRGETKADALEFARVMLTRNMSAARLQSECAKFKQAAQEQEDQKRRELEARREERAAEVRASFSGKIKSIPRRRQQIFEESKGLCHYCSTPLTLDGKWHIEHKMPKALGGGNEPGNLVASCVSCNHKKRDTTDIEFKARMAKEAA